MSRFSVFIGVLLVLAGVARAADPATVKLSSGDVLHGTLLSNDGVMVVLDHEVLGVLSIPFEQVSKLTVEEEDGTENVVHEITDAQEEAEAEVEEALEAPAEDSPWSLRIEVGLDGAEGNTERFAGRFGFYADRETDKELFHFQTTYRRATEDGEKTAERFNTQIRNDWKLGDSPWEIFAQVEADVDEFKEYDLRLSGAVGVGYRFIDNENTKLVGRVGPGLAYEFGVEDEEIIPELFTGLDLSHKLSERQFINAYIHYIPDLSDTDNYLVRSGADWEYIMTDDGAMSLKIGFVDRYDNLVEDGVEKNDLDYYATINYRF